MHRVPFIPRIFRKVMSDEVKLRRNKSLKLFKWSRQITFAVHGSWPWMLLRHEEFLMARFSESRNSFWKRFFRGLTLTFVWPMPDVVVRGRISLPFSPCVDTQRPACCCQYLLLSVGIILHISFEERPLIISVVIHPFTEVISNVKAPANKDKAEGTR